MRRPNISGDWTANRPTLTSFTTRGWEIGLLRMRFPKAYGGLDGNAIHMVIVAEELSRSSFYFFTAYGGSVFCSLNLARLCSEEQNRY